MDVAAKGAGFTDVKVVVIHTGSIAGEVRFGYGAF
jgi:hypothetical protein